MRPHPLIWALLLGAGWMVAAPARSCQAQEVASQRSAGWATLPLEEPAIPALEDSWVRTPIDAFLLRELQRRGLTPSPPADRRTLIRRISYDLIGLPPSMEDVEAFVADDDPQAYSELVDRLLASPRHGERWAQHWLDLVKYADTCGYDKDKARLQAWPYRDYVIRAFNEDKPYERFVREQVAGDVLYPDEPDGIVALGFLAAGPWDFIGHVEVPESKIDGRVARNLDRDDVVSNTFNTFCSLTVQCARCHDHKSDPITQSDYYGLQAIFAAVDRAERPYDLDPVIARTRRELAAELQALRSQSAALQAEIAEDAGPRWPDLARRIDELSALQGVEKDPRSGYHSALASNAEAIKWVEVDLGRSCSVASIVLRPCHDEFAGIGAGFGFPQRFRVEVAIDATEFSSGNGGGASEESQLTWITIADRCAEDVPRPGLKPFELRDLEVRARRVRVTATKLAERTNDFCFALAELEVWGTPETHGEAAQREVVNLALGRPISAADSIEAPVRWARANLNDGLWARALDTEHEDELAALQREHIEITARIETPERIARRETLHVREAAVLERIAALPEPQRVYAAATHFKPEGSFQPTLGQPRAIRVLKRGEVEQAGELVSPSILELGTEARLEIDGAWPEGERRAALAHWLTRRDHPLVWRSLVNRVWQHHFGRGLCDTPNDFGRMGAPPSHPELLDWLACDFRDGGQSLKRLHRMIVMSSAYRQAWRHDDAHAAADGGDRFLWRMPRRRMSAEEIRDSILAASGALDLRAGGPGFYNFVIEKPEHSPHYQYHAFDPRDATSHRRSIYRFIVRSQPDPWMTTLDGADSSQSTPRRHETLTALQALTLLNSPFNLAMAERFADRLQREANHTAARVDLAVRLLLQRSATVAERVDFSAYAEEHGLANLCRVLFNLNEFVYLD